MPEITVVIACYNASRHIEEALKSVRDQTFTDFECIIVDDFSTDDSVYKISRFIVGDDRFILLKRGSNSGGASVPRNDAIEMAKGSLIAFLDADDIWYPDKLKNQYFFMKDNGFNISSTAYKIINDKGEIAGKYSPPKYNSYSQLLKVNTLGCSTVMVKRDFMGGRRFPVCGHEDYALWLDLSRDGEVVAGMPMPLASYRLTGKSLSSNKIKVASYIWKIFRKREKFNFFYSFFCCVRFGFFIALKYRSIK